VSKYCGVLNLEFSLWFSTLFKTDITWSIHLSVIAELPNNPKITFSTPDGVGSVSLQEIVIHIIRHPQHSFRRDLSHSRSNPRIANNFLCVQRSNPFQLLSDSENPPFFVTVLQIIPLIEWRYKEAYPA
jgi:hypothetical protein